MIFLRQSTASQEIPLGRFVDSTNGNDEETGLTINNTDIKLWKTGATTLASKNSGGATHIANGEYYCVLDATDTDTIGPMKVAVHVAGALSVQVWCTVLDEAVYDVMFGTTAIATATNITAGTITTATNVTTVNGLAAGVITAASIAADAITDAKVASDVTIASVTGAVGSVTGNVGGNVTGSVGSVVGAVGSVTAAITLPTIPTAWITADGIATDAIGSAELAASAITEIQAGLSTLDAAGIRTAVGLASANLDTQLSTIDDFLDTEIAALTTLVNDVPTNAELATALASADDAVLAAIAALNNLSAAQVNAQVLDCLAVDTYAEPSQGAPAATATLAAKINYIYKAWRNKKTQTATTFSLFADDGTTVDQKATTSDDGTTTTVGEVASGP